MKQFAPLHIISGYTFLSSGLTIEKIKESVKKQGYFGVALTDFGVLYGIPSFIKAMEDIHVPFLVGMDIPLDNLVFSLYAINEEGYRSLALISSLYQKEELSLESMKNHSSSLVGILNTAQKEFKDKFQDQDEHFRHQLLKYSKLFKYFYLGISVTNKEENKFANDIRKFAHNYSYDTIAFPEIRYQCKDDAIVLTIVNAIKNDLKIEEKKKTGNLYFLSEEDYLKIYTKQEVENTRKLVSLSTFSYHQKRGEMLHYPVANSVTYLHDLAFSKLKEFKLEKEEYITRLNNELEVINKMGYADYFLIVQDYVNYAKMHDIIVGPGRGSAAGSLVSYVLGITEIDPLKYHLQFERFLTIYRKTMPDIDIDFMDIKRDQMVQYMREKYGNEQIANIVTFQTIMAKQSLRDIGRIYNYRNEHIDLLSKSIALKDTTLRESYKKEKAFRDLVDSDSYFLEIVSLASKIEGLPRQEGLHAAGIIANNTPMVGFLPVHVDFDGHYISQYEMNFLEEQGFLKMDFLGLRNLTTIAYALMLIKKEHPESTLTPYNIPYEDPHIFELISEGNTMGIFQLESAGMRQAIQKIKPKVFEDIVILLSLYRPGPMDNINDFVSKKLGRKKITYLNEQTKKVLEETYGIIVYQEQVNSIAQVMAGFSLAEADVFRRAVSKKKKEVLEEQRSAFINGCIKNGHNQKIANQVFEDILKFANYGFNKSHAVGYAMIAARMGYLKYYYPREFYASILETSSSASDAKFPEYIREMKKRNYSILLPDINRSTTHFEICQEGLLYPLSSIKEINRIIVGKILDERNQNGIFKDFFDFALRMYPHHISEKQFTRLINAGAFDCFKYSRSSLLEMVLPALQYSELNYSENGQMMLSNSFMPPPNIPEIKDNPLEIIDLQFESLGVVLGDNPLKFKKDVIKQINASEISELNAILQEKIEASNDQNSFYYNKQEIFVIGTIVCMIQNIKIINTRKNQSTMAFIQGFDTNGSVEIIVFPKIYNNYYQLLIKNNIIVVEGKLENRDGKVTFIANAIRPLEE